VSSTLIGTTEEIYDKLVALNEAGAEYVILNVLGGSRHTLRRFANEIICRSCNEGQASPGFNFWRSSTPDRATPR
jgi:hypothetical protein